MKQKNMQWSNNMNWNNTPQWNIGEEEWKERRRKQYVSLILILCTWIIIMGIWGENIIRKTTEATTEAVTETVIKAVTEAMADEVSDEVAEKVKEEVANVLLAKEVSDEMDEANEDNEANENNKVNKDTIKIVKSTSIFKEPNESSELVRALGPGEEIVLEKDVGKGWLKVSNDTIEGYVYYYLTDYKPNRVIDNKNNSVKGKTGTTTKICSLRKKPGISKKHIKFVNRGSKLELLSFEKLIKGEKYGWYKVKVDNETGYIYGDAIKAVAEKETTKKGRMITVMKEVKMYEEAKQQSIIVATVKKGAKLNVREANQPGWLEVINGNDRKEAYIYYLYTDYAKERKPKTIKKYKKAFGVICAERVNLREKPGTTEKVKDCLFIGSEVTILTHVEVIPGERYGWYYVETKTGKKGYVYGELLQKGKRETIKEKIPYSNSSNNGSSSNNDSGNNSNRSNNDSGNNSNSSNNDSGSNSNSGKGSKKEYQKYAKELCREKYNWEEDQFEDLVKLWEHESGWDPNNSYGSCYGIPQRNGSSHGIPDSYKNDWKEQIRWGLKYIEGRYGNPSKAWSHFCDHNWY